MITILLQFVPVTYTTFESILSPLLKNPKYINMQIFVMFKVQLWNARCLPVHSKVHSSLEASCFHITLVYAEYWTRIGFLTICDVTNHACIFLLSFLLFYPCPQLQAPSVKGFDFAKLHLGQQSKDEVMVIQESVPPGPGPGPLPVASKEDLSPSENGEIPTPISKNSASSTKASRSGRRRGRSVLLHSTG